MKSLTLGMTCLALCLALVAMLAASQVTRAATAQEAQAAAQEQVERVDAVADADALALVQGRCASCHPLQRTCDKLGFKDLDQWTATVTRMVAKGARLTEAEIVLVSEYLNGLPVGDPAVCE